MLCITGLETGVDLLLGRLHRLRAFPMHEIRLDALSGAPPDPSRLPVPAWKLVITCRRAADGGRFEGSEEDRLRRLEEGLVLEPGWMDLEADLEDGAARRLLDKARDRGVKVLRSLHRFRPGGAAAIARDLERLARREGDGIKLAAAVEDAADLEPFLAAPRDRPAVLIGMGAAGILTRVLHRRFGGAWTYVAAEPWPDAASGIVDLERAVLYDMPVAAGARLFVLVGDASIAGSPGPRVYNRLFRERRFRGVYLPAVTRRFSQAFRLLQALDLQGASVTVPHKAVAMAAAEVLSAAAREARAVNTLYRKPSGAWAGDNTDVEAVGLLADRLAPGRLRAAAVLGTGGFARAAALALSRRGITVTLFGRSRPSGPGPWSAARLLPEIEEASFDVLVNATPLGRRPGEDPLAGHAVDLAGTVVIDGVLSPEPTPLLRRAAAQGAVTAGGYDVWVEQGARQMALFGGPGVEAPKLAGLLREGKA